MKYKFFIPILSAVLLGYLCANFILNEYNDRELALDNNVYFLQVGAYNNLESSNETLKNIQNKLTVKEDNKYYSYIGITSSSYQAERIKNIYKKENIDLYIKKVKLDNNKFINELVQYDVLLKNSKNIEEINSVLKTILATYEENLSNL